MIRAIDFETTGEPPDAAVCEAARVDLVDDDGEWRLWPVQSTLVDPERFIPPEASGIHHIVDADVKGAPTWATAAGWMVEGGPCDSGNDIVWAAHYARFERAFFDPPGGRWIDTWKVAMRLAPQAPGWGLQCLRYYVGLKVDPALAMPPHRAGPDAYLCASLLRRMLAKKTVDEMVAISAEPALLPRITFGKHKGGHWSDVPMDYLHWLVDKSDMDVDTKHTAQHWLTQRRLRR